MRRRSIIAGLAGSLLARSSIFEWLFGDEDEDEDDETTTESSDTAPTDFSQSPASDIENYPLEHGTDVDAPADGHHARPDPGRFLTESESGFELRIIEEIHSFTLSAGSSGTYSLSFEGAYAHAIVSLYLPGDGDLSNVEVVKRQLVNDSNDQVAAVELDWANDDLTNDYEARIRVLGFRE